MDKQFNNALSLIYSRQCVPESLLVREMAECFHKSNDHFVAVHRERKIIGIISKEKLMLEIGSQFGWALYANKTITVLMDNCPLIVNASVDIVSIFKNVVSRPPEKVYDDIIVENQGKFAGLISVRQLMWHHSLYLEQQLSIIDNQKKLLEKTIASHLLDRKVDPDTWAKKLDEIVNTAQKMELLEEKSNHQRDNDTLPVTLQGSLDIFSVIDLIQLLIQGCKTGRLRLFNSPQSQTSSYTLFVDHGSIVHAESFNSTGKDTLFEALRMVSGHFVFHYNSLSDKITIHENPIFLLLESCRMQDEEAVSFL